jgi:hypothetical protein
MMEHAENIGLQPRLSLPKAAGLLILENSCIAQAKDLAKTISHFNLPQTEREEVIANRLKPTIFQDSQQVYYLRKVNRELRQLRYILLGQVVFLSALVALLMVE